MGPGVIRRARGTRVLAALVLAALGGVPFSSPAAASTLPPAGVFATSGFKVDLNVTDPVDTRPIGKLYGRQTDRDGVLVHKVGGQRVFQPVATAQYAIAAIVEYEKTKDLLWLDRAARNADYIIANHVESGSAWWYQYDYPHTTYDRLLPAGWWSGMAQGEALTAFSKLAQLQPKVAKWRTAAEHTWIAFTQRADPDNAKPWSTTVIDGHLWFEEYASNSQPPTQVLNGHIFAIYGLYEYYKLTHEPEVARYIDGGVTSVLRVMDKIRVPGGVAYYCADRPYCANERWQSKGYHTIVVGQLATLARITNDPGHQLETWSEALDHDWQAPFVPTIAPAVDEVTPWMWLGLLIGAAISVLLAFVAARLLGPVVRTRMTVRQPTTKSPLRPQGVVEEGI